MDRETRSAAVSGFKPPPDMNPGTQLYAYKVDVVGAVPVFPRLDDLKVAGSPGSTVQGAPIRDAFVYVGRSYPWQADRWGTFFGESDLGPVIGSPWSATGVNNGTGFLTSIHSGATFVTPDATLPAGARFTWHNNPAMVSFAERYDIPRYVHPALDNDPSDDIPPHWICFLPGTRIATPGGEVPVEALQPGDPVITCGPDGAPAGTAPVAWVGRQRRRIPPDARDEAPVRIAAGALAPGVPARDLRVSHGHALLLDGALVRAGLIVNGITVGREAVPADGLVEMWHVELPFHGLLLSDGAPSESYLDCGNRAGFAAGGGAGDAATYKARACLPVLEPGDAALLAIRERLLQRALSGAGLRVGHGPALRLDAPGAAPCGEAGFTLPAPPPDGARLLSRSGVPMELDAGSQDGRRLGVAIRAIELRQGARLRVLDAADPALDGVPGWHGAEEAGELRWRWMDDDAALPAAIFAGFAEAPLTLALTLHAAAPVLLEADRAAA